MGKKEDTIEVEGKITDVHPNMTFIVQLDNGVEIQAFLCGKMRMRNIRVITGDRVTVEMTPYDLTKGRITYRGSKKN